MLLRALLIYLLLISVSLTASLRRKCRYNSFDVTPISHSARSCLRMYRCCPVYKCPSPSNRHYNFHMFSFADLRRSPALPWPAIPQVRNPFLLALYTAYRVLFSSGVYSIRFFMFCIRMEINCMSPVDFLNEISDILEHVVCFEFICYFTRSRVIS